MKVAITSSDTQKFTKNTNYTVSEIASRSIVSLLSKSKIQKAEVDGLIVSSNSFEPYLSNIVSEMVGLKPKFSTKVENLCNSGTSGILLAYSLIRSGICKAVLVTGVEKQDSPGNKLIWDISRGIYDMPVHWASLYANNHFQKFGTREKDLALISLKNHRNANKNPNAIFFDKTFTFSQIIGAVEVAAPLRKFDCCYPCEGVSSVLLVSEDLSVKFEQPIWIVGISQSNQGASIATITDNLDGILSTRIAAKEAFRQADLVPSDIDIAELHDAFSILEIIAYEDIGFVSKGDGKKMYKKHRPFTNKRGGLLGCGHPIGATGIDQTNEIVLQLQGLAGQRQVANANIGLVHNMAAAGTSTTIIILQK
ncbi:MAG: thiolase family protein [Candidatus Nitrosocosmicus sp.]|jgi:acetyl-CoA C-acetyltransferase|nr:3-ketoacyl-CoA thiolase [Candidatus Nitrosocosmicus sp.]